MYTEPVAIKALMGDRKVFRIAVSPTAKAVVAQWAEQIDMTEIGVASRIYEWFSQQPDELQRGILGLYGSRTPDIARMALQGLDADKDADAGKLLDSTDSQARASVRKAKRRRNG